MNLEPCGWDVEYFVAGARTMMDKDMGRQSSVASRKYPSPFYPLPPAGGEGGVRGCGRTNFFRQSPGQDTSAFPRTYQMTLLQCLWMVASLVTRLACATIAAATINRSKGSRVHARPTASFTMEWNDCGAVSRSISSRRAANTTSGPFMIRLISNRYCSRASQ